VKSELLEHLDAIVRRLIECYQPERIYLFGSVARSDSEAEQESPGMPRAGRMRRGKARRRRVLTEEYSEEPQRRHGASGWLAGAGGFLLSLSGPDSDYDAEESRRSSGLFYEHQLGLSRGADVLVATRGSFEAKAARVAASLPATVLRKGQLLYAA